MGIRMPSYRASTYDIFLGYKKTCFFQQSEGLLKNRNFATAPAQRDLPAKPSDMNKSRKSCSPSDTSPGFLTVYLIFHILHQLEKKARPSQQSDAFHPCMWANSSRPRCVK